MGRKKIDREAKGKCRKIKFIHIYTVCPEKTER